MDKLSSLLLSNGPSRLGLLDGGQATHLESFGYDISSSLWSASLLASASPENNPAHLAAIKRLHADFLRAGAQVVGTLTYQLCDEACRLAGWSEESVRGVPELFERAIRLAGEARDEHRRAAGEGGGEALVALSLGPYATALANGAEYTGDYAPSSTSGQGSQPTQAQLTSFHKRRLSQALRCPSFSRTIDLVAFETVPRLDEARAILAALGELAAEAAAEEGAHLPPAYISFVFPPDAGGRLPWPPAEGEAAAAADSGKDEKDETSPGAALRLILEYARELKRKESSHGWPAMGIGLNCTKPHLVAGVVREMSRAYVEAEAEPVGEAAAGARSSKSEEEGLHLFVSHSPIIASHPLHLHC